MYPRVLRRILFLALFLLFLAGTGFVQTVPLKKLEKSQCSLSKILQVEQQGKTLAVKTTLNNQEVFECCWSPETIVQYVFDCSLNPLAKVIFRDAQFKSVNRIQLTVYPKLGFRREIVFFLKKNDWVQYRKSEKRNARAVLYGKLKVTANGQPLEFDPVRAQDVE